MAAGATYEPIATQTLASAATTITFSSIAASWTDLRLIIVAKEASATYDFLQLQFNGDTSTNYSYTDLYGTGSSASSGRVSNAAAITINRGSGLTATYGFYSADIFSYVGSTYKTILTTGSEDNNGSGGVTRTVGLWRSTSAITSLLIKTNGSDIAIGTTATLYGIKAA